MVGLTESQKITIPAISHQNFLSIILIMVLGFAAYGNSLNNGFIWDDDTLVEKNKYITDWSYLPHNFIKGIGGTEDKTRFYRPLQTVTYMIDYSLWKLNPKGCHLTNILLHIAVALSLYWLISIIFNDRFLAFLTGVFFVVHPIHTEAVTYISGRADPLAALLMLLCLTFYIISPPANIGAYCLMFLSYAAALLSRENSLVLPALILIYHYSFKSKLKVKAFMLIASVASVYILLRLTVLKFLLSDSIYSTTIGERLPGVFVAVTNYIKLLVFPFNFHMEYGRKLFHWNNPEAILGVMILLLLFIYAFTKRKDNQTLFFAMAWFIVALLPSSNLYPINAYMAEHWMYFPSIGFFLLIAKGLQLLLQSSQSRAVMVIFSLSLLFMYSLSTVKQNIIWGDPIRFYERTLKFAPESSLLYYNLGNAYKVADKNEEAIRAYQKSIDIEPNYVEVHNNLGTMYYRMSRNEKAIAAYKKAVEVKPDHAGPYYNLGLLYNKIGDTEKAIVSYKKAIEYNRNYAIAYNNLAIVYFQKKQFPLSVEYFEKAEELGFSNPAFSAVLKPYREWKEKK